MRIFHLTCAAALTLSPMVVVAAPSPAAAAVAPCRNGRVALTFDDGPGPQTSRLLRVLRSHDAPATFFVVGQRVGARSAAIRAMVRDGHVVANHSWDHSQLTKLSSRAIRSQLTRTTKAVVRAGAPRPTIMRPPYGATNGRVRAVTRSLRLREVLWTIDTTDWNHRSSDYIVRAALRKLRKSNRNNILMHDGVGNSRRTVAAVPRIISGIRRRGYCLTVVGPQGLPADPRPKITADSATVTEGNAGTKVLRIPVRLSSAAVRRASVRVRTQGASARSVSDYKTLSTRVAWRPRTRNATISVRIVGDTVHEATQRFFITFSNPSHARTGTKRIVVTVKDNDTAPVQ